MAPQKKRPTVKQELPLLARFEDKKILMVIDGRLNTESQLNVWRAQLGKKNFRVVTALEAKKHDLPEGDWTHVAVGLPYAASDEKTAALEAKIEKLRPKHVVTLQWVEDSRRLLTLKAKDCKPEADYRWASEPSKKVIKKRLGGTSGSSDDEGPSTLSKRRRTLKKLLPDCVVERKHSVSLNKNVELTAYFRSIDDWWEYGTLDAHELMRYANKCKSICRVTALLACWPTTFTKENWASEKDKLQLQSGVDAKSTSATGGYLTMIEDFVFGRPSRRPDSPEAWSSNPKRVAMRDLKKLKLGLSRSTLLKLVNDCHVKSAEDLYERRDEKAVFAAIGPATRELVTYARRGPSAIPMDAEETEIIVNNFRKVAETLKLHFDVVGSYRRGKIGGHDLDFLFCPSLVQEHENGATALHEEEEDELSFSEKQRLMGSIQDTYGSDLVKVVVGLHFHQKNGDKLFNSHVVVKSPKIQNAFRHIDLVLTPPSLYPHALLQWSGSRTFIRCLHDYVAKLHVNDRNAKGERRGLKGWNLDDDGNKIPGPLTGRRCDPSKGERWYWSSSGAYIATDHTSATKKKNVKKVYEESNTSFPNEQAIFHFFFLDFLLPADRCA